MTFPNTEKDLVQHSAHYVCKENCSRQNGNTKKVKVGRKPSCGGKRVAQRGKGKQLLSLNSEQQSVGAASGWFSRHQSPEITVGEG